MCQALQHTDQRPLQDLRPESRLSMPAYFHLHMQSDMLPLLFRHFLHIPLTIHLPPWIQHNTLAVQQDCMKTNPQVGILYLH